MDFEKRIKTVIPMLEAKGLFGVASLIKDLKKEVDKGQSIRFKAIDEFVEELDKCCGWEKGCIESLEVTRRTYLQVAEHMKGGA